MSENFDDFADVLPNLDVQCVMDVGANVGNTVSETLKHFPKARVHALEPVSQTYRELSQRFAGDNRVFCHHFALAAREGKALITARGTATGNKIVKTQPGQVPVETIEVKRGDDFARSNGIEHLSLLKIDTEGYDLDVLKGFSDMLSNQAIDLFQVEVSLGLQNKKHVDLAEIRYHPVTSKYWLFKVFNQTYELDGRPILRRADAIFISNNCMEANKRPKNKKRNSLFKRVFRRMR